MTSAFRAVLFDCDGVLQRPSNDWQSELVDLLDSPDAGTVADFFAAMRDAEVPTLDGSTDFGERLQAVLDDWQVPTPAAEVLQVWQHLAVDAGMLDAARDLKAAGLVVALGTNQHAQRAAYLRRELGYDEVFDPILISCEIGRAKPDPLFFRIAVQRLGFAPDEVLFTDDVLANVEGAREAGLVAELFAKSGGRPELDRILALHGLAEPLAA